MRFTLEATTTILPADGSRPRAEDVDRITDYLQDALLADPEAGEADLIATLRTGEIAVSMTIEGDNFSQALQRAETVFRRALDTIGLDDAEKHAPRWDVDQREWRVLSGI